MVTFSKIFSIASAAILLIATVLLMFFNLPFFWAKDNFGTIVVTIAVFVGILVFAIVNVVKNKSVTANIVIPILCLSLLVIPIRGFIASAGLREPFDKIKVELVDYKQDYENHKDVISCELRYTNETGVDIDGVNGKLSFYDGDKHLGTYDVSFSGIFSCDEPFVTRYTFEGDALYNADYSDLTIIYTFESIRAEIYDFSYDALEVKLK